MNIKILREGVEVREHKTSVTVATFYWRAYIKPGKWVVMPMWVGGLRCLTSLSTIFQLYRGGQFYWWRKPEYPKKTTDLPQTLSHNLASSTHSLNGIRTHNVSGDRYWLHS